jgi:hypothetical protein
MRNKLLLQVAANGCHSTSLAMIVKPNPPIVGLMARSGPFVRISKLRRYHKIPDIGLRPIGHLNANAGLASRG